MAERPDSLFRSAGVISVMTMLSRALGLVRDCVCAAFFGAGTVWDAFSFAFRIPNMFRMLFGEGALTAAFVPAFTESLELRGREEAWRLAGRVAATLAVVLVGAILVAEAVVLGLMHGLALSDRWRLALGLTAFLLPHMAFVCLTALAGAALNSLRHFAAPAFAPALLNICWIVGVAAVAPAVSPDPRVRIFIVAGAILLAGVLELALQVAVLKARGFKWRPAIAFRHPDVRRLAAGMGPVALGMAALQVNLMLDGVIAISLAAPPDRQAFGFLGATIAYPMAVGANSVLYYANRLMQLPLGVFGIAIATAAFPALSRHAARQDWRGFSDAFRRGMGAVLFIAVPAGVGLILLRRPVIVAVLQRGAFTAETTLRTARAVLAYSTAIWAYCAVHMLTRAFYSIRQPGTPAKVAASMVGLNLALNLTLVWPLGEAGLAAATALCATVQMAVLYWMLARRVPLVGTGAVWITALKTVIATACMSVVCIATLRALPEAPTAGGLAVKLLRVCVPAASGGAAYLTAAALLRMEELEALVRRLRLCLTRVGQEEKQPAAGPDSLAEDTQQRQAG